MSFSIISEKLVELEQVHDIKILWACESGSRAWGFPSPDSDYDARIIYVHPQEWYLSIHEKRDVLELPVNQELDISGWELRKALRLVHKHNAVIFEWLQSPIVYYADDRFAADFRNFAERYFSPLSAMHHYLSSGNKYYLECTQDPEIKLKKLFYCLRVTLAALWIAHHRTIPPMELDKLLNIVPNEPLVYKIKELKQLKALQPESYKHPHEPDLEHFLAKSLKFCSEAAPSLPRSIADDTPLNVFFRKMLS